MVGRKSDNDEARQFFIELTCFFFAFGEQNADLDTIVKVFPS